MSDNRCFDCGVAVGQTHEEGCDVARCKDTGAQALSCLLDHEHNGTWCGSTIWTGTWPGEIECEEFGWWCVFQPGQNPSFLSVSAGTEGATHDLNRLSLGLCTGELIWDTDKERAVKP